MAANINPIFPVAPYTKSVSLATFACTTRAPTATASLTNANGFALLSGATTNGFRVDEIKIQASASAIGGATVAGLVGIWRWDGTTAYLIDEYIVSAVTPSATVVAFSYSKEYTTLVLEPAAGIYVSTSIALAAATTALAATLFGGTY